MIKNLDRKEIEKIMKAEGLSDWKLTITNHGSCCWCKDKKIWIDERQLNISMALHEIAHALLPEKERHTVLWADEYTKLVEKYCQPRLQNQAMTAEGKMEISSEKSTSPNLIFLYEELGNNKCKFHNITEILRKYDGKKVRILLEEIK